MPRRIRASREKLETRSSRLTLAIAKKPIFVKIRPGVGLGYRRNQTAGTWVVRVADGKGHNWTKAIAAADDFGEANGNTVLDFWQAQDKALAVASMSGEVGSEKPATVRDALDTYENDLKARGGDVSNVSRVRSRTPTHLLDKAVASLTWRELRKWRDDLIASAPANKKNKTRGDAALSMRQNPGQAARETLSPATVNRTCTVLKAALNLVSADPNQRITNSRAWEGGLATIRDAERSRNVILEEPQVRQILARARDQGPEFGLLVEVAAVTGARYSQIARLEVRDLQPDGNEPRLMMPMSRKGKGQRRVTHRPVPIPSALAARLAAVATDRPPTTRLLLKPLAASDRARRKLRHANGSAAAQPWKKSDQTRPFERAVKAAGLDPDVVTLAALRHTSIVRQLLRGVTIRVVAANHDTSVAMIEKTYSLYITDHSDALVRGAMLDISKPVARNVVSIKDRAKRRGGSGALPHSRAIRSAG